MKMAPMLLWQELDKGVFEDGGDGGSLSVLHCQAGEQLERKGEALKIRRKKSLSGCLGVALN